MEMGGCGWVLAGCGWVQVGSGWVQVGAGGCGWFTVLVTTSSQRVSRSMVVNKNNQMMISQMMSNGNVGKR